MLRGEKLCAILKTADAGRHLERTRYYGGVDLVRFASAMLVLLFHLGWAAWLRPHSDQGILVGPLAAGHAAPAPSFWLGWIGVQIFFVISGLVIANSASAATPIEFLKGRIYRLYPVAWICATISAAIFLALGLTHHLAVRYAGSMLLLPFDRLWLSNVYWTLGVEMVFYAAVFLAKLRWPDVSLLALATALLFWNGLYLAIVYAGGRELPGPMEELLLLRYGAFFALGIALWTLSEDRRRWPAYAIAALSIAVCLSEIFLKAHRGGPQSSAVAPATIWIAAVMAIYAGTTRLGSLQFLPPWALNCVRTAGLMTYPIYLFHDEVGGLAMRVLLWAGLEPGMALLGCIATVLAAACCVVVFGEKRLRRLLRSAVERVEASTIRGRPRFGALYRPARKSS
jgi:exopolysaccharide production protein ExoZ